MGVGTLISNVFSRNLGQARFEAAKDIKGAIMDTAGEATGGVLGNRNMGQQNYNNTYGPLPRPESPMQQQSQRMMQLYGHQGGVQQQPRSLGEVLGGALSRTVNLIAPQPGGALDRVTRGAVGSATIAAGVALTGAQAMPDRISAVAGQVAQTASAATPPAYEEAKSFPIRQQQIQTKDLAALPPLVTTSVTPTEDFTVAATSTKAAPAGPAVQAPAAEATSRFGADTYASAANFLKQNGPGPG